MARLGSQTERIVRGDRLLAQEETDVSAGLADALSQDGIKLHFNTTVQQVDYTNRVFSLTLSNGEVMAWGDTIIPLTLPLATSLNCPMQARSSILF